MAKNLAGRLNGKTALVTGGGSGIGRATSLAYAREGARVAVADVNVEGGEETVQQIKEAGGEAILVHADVAKPEDTQAMVEKAVEAFGMCAHLDPAEGDYSAHLGYSLYLSNVRNELVRKEALEHIARGIKLSPEQETAYVFLGRIFKVMGDIDVAERMFARALSIQPDCRAAEQELRLIEMRERKAAGLVSKLWSR